MFFSSWSQPLRFEITLLKKPLECKTKNQKGLSFKFLNQQWDAWSRSLPICFFVLYPGVSKPKSICQAERLRMWRRENHADTQKKEIKQCENSCVEDSGISFFLFNNNKKQMSRSIFDLLKSKVRKIRPEVWCSLLNPFVQSFFLRDLSCKLGYYFIP